LVKLNYLAPDIVATILDGQQPGELTVYKLLRTSIPLDWAVQRQLLGSSPRHDVGGSLIRQDDRRRWNPVYGYSAPDADGSADDAARVDDRAS
jgi:hypothetical protein